MINFRDNNTWLRHRIDSIIRINHKELFESTFQTLKRSIAHYSFDRKRWWLVLLLVSLTFILSLFINIPFLNFITIKPETAKYIVDQRTANIATIVSITLVVVGFLINNLAVKEPFAYRILFKHSYLYPIIYLTLSTIGWFVIISTLRDSIDPEKFPRVVIAGSYLVLLILLLIGLLFKTIIHFTNAKQIDNLFHLELMTEAKENLKNGLVRKISYDQYSAVMNQFNVKKYDWIEAWNSPGVVLETKETTMEEFQLMHSKDKIVKDINMVELVNFIQEKTTGDQIYYKDLIIGVPTTEFDSFIWVKGQINSEEAKKRLKKCLILKKRPKQEKDSIEVRKFFDQKLEDYVSRNNHKGVEEILNSYVELYELQMKHLS